MECPEKNNQRMSSIQERIFIVEFAPISEDVFLLGLPKFEEYCRTLSGSVTRVHKAEWNIKIKIEGSVPELDRSTSKLMLHERFLEEPKDPDWVFQVHRDKFIFNDCRNKLGNSSSFPKLYSMGEEAFQRFSSIFNLKNEWFLALSYVMSFNPYTIANTEISNQGWLELKKLSSLFAAVGYPKHSDRYVHPISYNQKWEGIIQDKRIAYSCQTQSVMDKQNPCPVLEMLFSAALRDKTNSLEFYPILFTALSEMFDILLTPEAKDLFAREDWI
jgi:hypothetical protein